MISEKLLAELERALAYPKLRKRIPPEKAATFANLVREHGILSDDPASAPPVSSRDRDDDYVLALAISRRGYLVTGDQDLLVLSTDLPVRNPPGSPPRSVTPAIGHEQRNAGQKPLAARWLCAEGTCRQVRLV